MLLIPSDSIFSVNLVRVSSTFLHFTSTLWLQYTTAFDTQMFTDLDVFFSVAESSDPLRKREEFAVSLRKIKKQNIITERRKRLMLSTTASNAQHVSSGAAATSSDESGYHDNKMYDCCPMFREECNEKEPGRD